ncbi:Hypothetical predicted protein, partial [Paramuricea clavata]
ERLGIEKANWKEKKSQMIHSVSGFTEEEVKNGVIRAISPDQLRKIIRSHYGVKDTTEMYENLASFWTPPPPQAFLIRALDLRQKILFASDEDTSVLKYKEHIQKLFLKTVETGLQDESIRAKLRPYLKDINVLDEDLIQQLNAAVSSESERCRKLKSQSKASLKVNGQITMTSQDKEVEECQEGHYVLHVKKSDSVAAHTALFVVPTTTLQLAVPRDLLNHL